MNAYQGLEHMRHTRSETDALLRRMCAARDSGQRQRFERLRNEVVSGNLRLVYHLALKYQGRGLDLPDLVSEGALGMLHALDKFDPERGCSLSTYASNWIKQTIRRALQDKTRAVRVPVHRLEGSATLHRHSARFEAQHGRAPTDEDLAALTKRKARNVHEDLDATRGHTLSLDAPIGHESDGQPGSLLDFEASPVPSPLDALLMKERAETARAALGTLPDRERAVLAARHSDDSPTLATIGREVTGRTGQALTRERIRQIEHDGLQRLRARRGALATLRPND